MQILEPTSFERDSPGAKGWRRRGRSKRGRRRYRDRRSRSSNGEDCPQVWKEGLNSTRSVAAILVGFDLILPEFRDDVRSVGRDEDELSRGESVLDHRERRIRRVETVFEQTMEPETLLVLNTKVIN